MPFVNAFPLQDFPTLRDAHRHGVAFRFTGTQVSQLLDDGCFLNKEIYGTMGSIWHGYEGKDFGGVTILVQNPLWVKIVWIICKFHQSFTLKANGMKVISRPQSTTQSVWWCLKPKNVMGNILPSDSAVDVNQETKPNLHNFISACYLPAQFLPSMQPPTLHSPQQDVRLAPLRRHVSPGRPHLNEPSKWVGGHSNSEDRGKTFQKCSAGTWQCKCSEP